MASDKTETAPDKAVWIEKIVSLDGSDAIKGDPGRVWNAPPKPLPPTPSTESAASQSSGNTNAGGSDSTSESKS